MEWIDLRSDTVTHPTPAMWEAMAKAEVGDDVYGEDPTINRLEAMSADLLGKESALFVPSGTMGNLAAVLTHCTRGDEIILGDLSHTFLYEGGGVSTLGGVHTRTVANLKDGTMDLASIEAAIRPDDPHYPITRLICLENTHNRCGGAVLSLEYTRQVAELAKKYGLSLHLDGARIFNAAVALGVEARQVAEQADSVAFCLSKSLCAPVGSVICGGGDFIRGARRIRKQLGGGMRQAGILAAAGVVALETMVDRLAEDHRRARRLADELREIPGVVVDNDPPPSNMVYLRFTGEQANLTEALLERSASERIKLGEMRSGRMRLVVHYWIDDAAIEQVIGVFRQVLGDPA